MLLALASSKGRSNGKRLFHRTTDNYRRNTKGNLAQSWHWIQESEQVAQQSIGDGNVPPPLAVGLRPARPSC